MTTLLLALLAVAGTAVAQNQTIDIANSGTVAQALQGHTVQSNAKIIIPTGIEVTINGTVDLLQNWNGILVVRGTLRFGNPSLFKIGPDAQIHHFGTIDLGQPNGNSDKIQFGTGNGQNGSTISTSEIVTFASQPGSVMGIDYNPSSPMISPLPVSMMYFRGKATGNTVVLEWATASEQNNDRFEIEASADGETWSKAGTVYSLNPNSYNRQHYTFEHRASSASYYRLKQFDFNGETSIYTAYVRNGATAEQVNRIEYRTLDGKLVNASTPGPKVKVNHYESGNLSTEVQH